MVVPPPLADLRQPVDRWQTVFAATPPLVRKSVQDAAGVRHLGNSFEQADEFRPIGAASFPQHLAMV